MDPVIRDEMTPLERAKALKQGHPVDRIPCVSHLGEHAAGLIGIPVHEYLHSSELMAKAQITAFRVYRQDGVTVGPDLFGLAEALGVKLSYSANERPQVVCPIVRHIEEVKNLEPPDPEKVGRLPLYLEALERIREKIGNEVVIGTGISGPFTTGAFLRGTEPFMKDLVRNPELAQTLLKLSVRSIIRYMDAALFRGFSCSMGEPLAAGNIIGPDLFREFLKPCLKEIADWYKNRTGSGPSLHICGDTRLILQDIVDTGIKSFKLDETVGLQEAKEAIGNRMALAGNVPPVKVLLRGSTKVIEDAVKSCIRKGHDTPKGYVLSAGCSVPVETPPENIISMMNAVRKYGRYPVDPNTWVD